MPRPPVLISAADLVALVRDRSDDLVVLDVRWALGGPPGRGDHLGAHVPGAVFVDLETELAAHGEPTDGRHPLPDPGDLQTAARRWGIRPGSTVVAYDATGNLAAARAWWLLRWAGLSDVRLLDGGLDAWIAAGGALEAGEVTPQPGDVVLTGGAMAVLEVDDVLAFAEQGTLLDARAGARFRGETEPIDPKAGHIPGALSAPTSDNLTDDGTFRPPTELRARFVALGVDEHAPVAAYCGSGVTAAHQVAALELAGFEGALYPGSWSQWSNQDRPVAVGDDIKPTELH